MNAESGNSDFLPRSFEDMQYLDRRTSPRFSAHLHGTEEVEVWLSEGATWKATIVDESLEGIGLSCDDHPFFVHGRVIDVIYRGKRKQAEIRYKRPDHELGEPKVKVGLHWC